MSLMNSVKLSACLFLVARSSTSAFSPARGAALGIRPFGWTVLGQNSLGHSLVTGRNVGLVQRHMTSGSSSDEPTIRHIGKEEMKQILMEHEEMVSADLESPYYIMDVRTEPEVEQTGKLGPSVPTLPVQLMMPPYQVLQMDDDEFEESFGFAKPPKEKTLVFSCAAGVRSVSACKLAHEAGYKDCINYMGGANEWFFS